LLVVPQILSKSSTPQGEKGLVEKSESHSEKSEPILDLDSSANKSGDLSDEYTKLQLRIFRVSILITALAVSISLIFFGAQFSFSLLLGAFSGILYLRLLARGIGKLGKTSKAVSKVQLLVPVVLVLVVSKLPDLQLLPALLGFILYKPSLIIQFLLEPSAKVKPE
jgi:ATP synthase protein I